MINEIKIDYTNPLWVNVWDNGSKEKYKRPYLYTMGRHHYCVHSHSIKEFLNGEDYVATRFDNIEFIKEKKRVPLDAKSCPRRPVLTHIGWKYGIEYYPSIEPYGLCCNQKLWMWENLFKDDGYKINGLPASREVDE